MQSSEEEARAAELLERLLTDGEFRAAFRMDPAGACAAFDLPELVEEFSAGAGGGKALHTLEIRESRSSLAGAFMAAASEGTGAVDHLKNLHDSHLQGGAHRVVHKALTSPKLAAIDPHHLHSGGAGVHELVDSSAGSGGSGAGGTAAAHLASTHDVQALLHNSHLTLSPEAHAALVRGGADVRLVGVLDELAKDHQLRIGTLHVAQGSTGGSFEILSVDGERVSQTNIAARDLAHELSALDPSMRPAHIITPWPIAGEGFSTSGSYEDRIQIVFEAPGAGAGPGAAAAAPVVESSVVAAPMAVPAAPPEPTTPTTPATPSTPSASAPPSTPPPAATTPPPAPLTAPPAASTPPPDTSTPATPPADSGTPATPPPAPATTPPAPSTPPPVSASAPPLDPQPSGGAPPADTSTPPADTSTPPADTTTPPPAPTTPPPAPSTPAPPAATTPPPAPSTPPPAPSTPPPAPSTPPPAPSTPPPSPTTPPATTPTTPPPEPVTPVTAPTAPAAAPSHQSVVIGAVQGGAGPGHSTLQFQVPETQAGAGGGGMVAGAFDPNAPGGLPDASDTYPGDNAGQAAIAAWMGRQAHKAGLPAELPIMAGLTESGLKNDNYGDRDSLGFFQMRTSIWNKGEYAGFPDHPELQLKWFIDHAVAVRQQAIERGDPSYGQDKSKWGDWVADVERPAEEYRYRYQTHLDQADSLLAQAGASGGTTPGADPAAAAEAFGAAASTGGSAVGVQALMIAERFKGTPYVWGGASPETGFDCSGLVQYSYHQLGIDLPRVTTGQFEVGVHVPTVDQLKPGDIVFFKDSTGYIHHEGIYIGNHMFLHAPHTGDVVKVSSLDEPYYAQQFAGGSDVSGLASGATPPAGAMPPVAPPTTPPVEPATPAAAPAAADAGSGDSGLFGAVPDSSQSSGGTRSTVQILPAVEDPNAPSGS